MRLLLVTQDFPPDIGGIQTWAHELAKRFHESCDHFGVVAPKKPGCVAIDRNVPYPVHRVVGSTNTMPILATGTILSATRNYFYDTVLHAQWQTMTASVAASKLGGPKRIFLAAHGRELLLRPLSRSPKAQKAYDALRRKMVGRADHLFPVSRYTAGLLGELGAPEDRMSVVGNGTDPDRFMPMDVSAARASLGLDQARVILTVGRLTPRKGIDTVIRALPKVIHQVPNAVYMVVGEGEDRSRLEALAREMGVSDHVLFEGAVPFSQLPTTYNLCDVFVTPSRSAPPSVEGFGIVFLEANACGKPVIGARSGGIPDAIVDGETGLLVEPDDEEGLTEALVSLLSDPARCQALGQAGRTRVEQAYTWDVAHDHLFRAMSED